jgi:GH24 family phage-related lysozyme (muramidase)
MRGRGATAPAAAQVAAPAAAQVAAPAAAAAGGGAAPAAAAAGGSGGGGKESLGATPPPGTQKSPGSSGGGIDDAALKNMIKQHEGVVQYPYKDSLGKWTIGVGHLIGNGSTLPPEFADYANNGPAYGPGSKNNNTTPAWSMEQVDQVLESDLQVSKQGASKNTKNFDTMSTPGKNAFVDLAFNMGPAWIQQKGFKSLDASLERKDNSGIKNSLSNSKWFTQVGDRGKQIVELAGTAFAEKGGMFNGPKSGYPATLHGNEAVIPLENGSVPVAMPKAFTDNMNKSQSFMDQVKEGFAKINNTQTAAGAVPVTMPNEFTEGMSKYNVILDQVKEGFAKISNNTTQEAGKNQSPTTTSVVGADAILAAFKQMTEEFKSQGEANRAIFDSMLRSQNNSNDIQNKMLRVAQS